MGKIETLPEPSKSERRHAQKKFGKELKVLDKEIAKRRTTSDGYMHRAQSSVPGEYKEFKVNKKGKTIGKSKVVGQRESDEKAPFR